MSPSGPLGLLLPPQVVLLQSLLLLLQTLSSPPDVLQLLLRLQEFGLPTWRRDSAQELRGELRSGRRIHLTQPQVLLSFVVVLLLLSVLLQSLKDLLLLPDLPAVQHQVKPSSSSSFQFLFIGSYQTPGHVLVQHLQLLLHLTEGGQVLITLLLLQELQLQLLQALNMKAKSSGEQLIHSGARQKIRGFLEILLNLFRDLLQEEIMEEVQHQQFQEQINILEEKEKKVI